MPFNSLEYFVFLWAAVLCFYAVPDRAKRPVLLAACYAFYAFWNLHFALFLLSATAATYFLALRMECASRAGEKRLCFSAALLFLLGAFVFFKGLPLWRQSFSFLNHVAVPVGFSYYTFRLLSYVLDVSWEKTRPEKDLVSFASYVAFFPHLLSGPIQRPEEFFPQYKTLPKIDLELWSSGLRLILCGLFKKLVVADNLALIVDNVFGHSTQYGAVPLWIASYAFYLQIYADFSGLTDIAIGSGRLFGIDSPPNFNTPYLAKNIQDFWRRWHMTLCRWINDYLFLPLRLQLRNAGDAGMVLALFISMLAISLWHGLSSGFIAFGILQGVLISVSVFTLQARNRFFKEKKALSVLRGFMGPLVTFHLLMFSFIFFRCATFSEAVGYISRMFQGPLQFRMLNMGLEAKAILGCVLALALAEWFERSRFTRTPVALRLSVYYSAITGLLMFGRFWPKEFIYFKF